MTPEVDRTTSASAAWRLNSVRWLTGYATSLIGAEVFYVAVAWAGVQTTTAANVSLLLLVNALPRALLLVFSGVLVDRIGPKKLVVASDSARAVIMVISALAILRGSVTLTLLLVIAVLFGVADGFFLPAVGAMPAFVAPPSALTQLQAMRTITIRASIFIGAPLGSWLVAGGSIGTAFLANAVLFAMSVAALALTRLQWSSAANPVSAEPTEDRAAVRSRSGLRGWFGDAAEGVRLVTTHPVLRTVIVVIALCELGFTGPVTAGVPLLVKSQGWGVEGVGWIMGAFGVGATTTALLLMLTKSSLRTGWVMGGALTLMGVGLGAVGAVPAALTESASTFVLTVGAALLTGLGAGLFGTLANTAVIRDAPGAQVGRIMSLISLVIFTSLPVSLAATGLLVEKMNASAPFMIGGALMAAGGILALVSRQIHELRL